jgi:hypothetical protein
MYIAKVPNRNSPPAILLRESFRQDGKVCSRTLANLSALSTAQIQGMKRALANKSTLTEAALPFASFEKIQDRSAGAADAVLTAMRKLGIAQLIDKKDSPERNLVLGMIACRILDPQSKLATTRTWHSSTLPETLGLLEATEDDVYDAMDWLFLRQQSIEKRLASRHLKDGGLVLYDLSSSYMEGANCPLAKRGYSRDGKKGTLQVNYGLLTDARGCPVAISVYEGNTSDCTTLLQQVDRARLDFGLKSIVIVGDRGMICEKQISELKKQQGTSWITALRSGAIGSLIKDGSLQMELFDERNLFSFSHPDFPQERLIACRNPELSKKRGYVREDLLRSTQTQLGLIQSRIQKGALKGSAKIGLCVGKVINRYKMAKHFILEITDTSFTFHIDEHSVASEAAMDGLYVIRTPLKEKLASDAQVVTHYKNLSRVERAFRCIKTTDLKVRPIFHRTENRVRAHIFLCMLAYYIEWHLKAAWAPILFADEHPLDAPRLDPVAPAKRSAWALQKCASKLTHNGTKVHSFPTLLKNLATITKSTFAPIKPANPAQTFTLNTRPSKLQQHAFDLLNTISP